MAKRNSRQTASFRGVRGTGRELAAYLNALRANAMNQDPVDSKLRAWADRELKKVTALIAKSREVERAS